MRALTHVNKQFARVCIKSLLGMKLASPGAALNAKEDGAPDEEPLSPLHLRAILDSAKKISWLYFLPQLVEHIAS